MRYSPRGFSPALASLLALMSNRFDWAGYIPAPRRERNDPDRLAAAIAKRERKNAKRLSDFRSMGLA